MMEAIIKTRVIKTKERMSIVGYSINTVKAIALDETASVINRISHYAHLTHTVELVKTFTLVNEATKFLAYNQIDVVFIDVDLLEAFIVNSASIVSDVMFVLTTAQNQISAKILSPNVVDCLPKPFTLERFRQAADKASAFHQFLIQHESIKEKDYIIIRVDYSLVKLRLSTIVLIEGLGDYVKIHLTKQKPYTIQMTLKKITGLLPYPDFIRVHRSYIIALSKVEMVKNNSISIGDRTIPIGDNYKNGFFDVFGV